MVGFLLCSGIGVGRAEVEPTPPVDRKVLLQVAVPGGRQAFRIGETIPIKLSFSSRVKDAYQLDEAQYDRSGRMDYEHFAVTPRDGAVDPLASYFASGMHMGGGLTGFSLLTRKPWTIQLNLNEWVRFTKPGEYRLTVSSERVEAVDSSVPQGTSPVTAISNEIRLKILPADPSWQRHAYEEAVATFQAPASAKDENDTRANALETLRFLGTPDATRELVKQMRGEDPGLDSICYLALVSSPERAVALGALEEALADPDRPIDADFLGVLSFVESKDATRDATQTEDKRKALDQLVRALPKKRGKALRVSLDEALNYAWSHPDTRLLAEETTQKLVKQLISIFDQLPMQEQAGLLEFRWNQIKSLALLPVLKRDAETDFTTASTEDYRNVRERTVWALRRWFELDPVGARPAIIHEITQPHPRFGSSLGMLPEKTLPEVDQALADHFTAADGDDLSNLASLIFRYATGAILPQVLKKFDQHTGDWEYDSQNDILAYILRVDPAAAKPRIEKTMAALRRAHSALCGNTFSYISAICYNPVLEEIAIHALDDPDPVIASDAARVLGRFGSPAVEAPLRRRYESWSKRWAGHESKLNLARIKDPVGGQADQLSLGWALLKALATGQAWLSDQSKLRHLAATTKISIFPQKVDQYLKFWDEQPLTIAVQSSAEDDPRFVASVAQYQFDSVQALEKKLSQFPSGTKFVLSIQSWGSTPDNRRVDEVRAFLTARGMSIREEKH